MSLSVLRALLASSLLVSLVAGARAQAAAAASNSTAAAQQGITLAQKGRCAEALPLLKRSTSRIADKELKYQAGMLSARCAMSLNQSENAVQALLFLRHEFPRDPEVLYITTHYYSQLAQRASEELVASAPNSYQARELNAEALESQNRWDEATTEYKRILEQDPNVHGIHYRLARILLSKPATETSAEEAKKELEQELKLDPNNAAAEFTLGELARRAGQWDTAAQHFSRAAKLDVGFSEAYLALGMSLASSGKYSEAIAPLESYVKMQPEDAAGHYQLAMAYSRTGQKNGAARELELQRRIVEKSQQGQSASTPH